MFDNLRCEYPLKTKGANELRYQTKDTPSQYLDNYKIKEDGTLWHEEYDVEDKSDPNTKGLEGLRGMLPPVNQRWVQENITGEIRFYSDLKGKWIEYSAYFVDGKLNQIHELKK